MILRQEYPRPQFMRKEWLNLNGEWEFEFDDTNLGLREKLWQKKKLATKIIVPFPFQSKLSGIGDTSFHDFVWYAKNFSIPHKWKTKEVILNFGAVDYECRIWINGRELGVHKGGHIPFSFNITKYLKSGENRLVLRVEDREDIEQPRGKQFCELEPKGCMYDRTTGIWQTVWLEPVLSSRIEYFRITPDIDLKTIDIDMIITGAIPGHTLTTAVYYKKRAVSKKITEINQGSARIRIPIKNPRLWSPETPNLYDIEFTLMQGEKKIDKVLSYFGMRKVSVKGNRILLNDKPYYLKLVLDQGYFPDGLLAAPSDRALKNDIKFTKSFGFNGCRKSQKIEDPRFLYWADKLGLIVWGEMANAFKWSERAEELFLQEWKDVVRRDYNHPCIITWVPFNESWGLPELSKNIRQQEFVKKVVNLTRELDLTRLIVDNDGWEHLETDLVTIHDYSLHSSDYEKNYAQFRKDGKTLPAVHRPVYVEGYSYNGKPILITEYGGIAYKLPGRVYGEKDFGYHQTETDEEKFIDRFKEITEAIMNLDFCCGFCYTQLTDVQQEINGLLTFDRIAKVKPEKISAILKNRGR